MVVSTCDRIEVSMTVPSTADATALVASTLADAGDLPADRVAPYLRRRQGRAAVEHVFRVAAALDSQVVGSQVLGKSRPAMAMPRPWAGARPRRSGFQAAFGPQAVRRNRHRCRRDQPGGHRGGALSGLHGDLASCADPLLSGDEAGAV